MSRTRRFLASFWFAALLAAPIVISGCAEHNTYRVYDRDHDDYHHWDKHESAFYVQWERDTHREHRDFDKREAGEQKEYWNWRHSHQ